MSRIPDTWVECEIGEISSVTGGGTPPSKNADNFTKAGGTPWITPADLSGYREIYISRGARNLTNRGLQNSSAKLLPKGAILFSSRAPIGYVAIASNPVCTNQGFKSFVLPDSFDPRFGYFYFKHIKPLAEERATGTTFKELSGGAAAQLPFWVAPIAEQKRIADKLEAVLGRVDACRERLARVPDLLKRFRQSVLAAATSGRLTEDWRGAQNQTESWSDVVGGQRITLPANYRRLAKQSFKPTTIEHGATELPKTWSVRTIGGLYDLKVLVDFADGNHGGLYPRKEEFGDDGALFLTATQMDDRWKVALEDCPRLNWTKAKQLVKGWARNHDVLLSHNATVGRVGLLEGVTEDVLLGTSVTFYRFNAAFVLPRFARIVFSSSFFQDQLESCMEQTTRDQVPITKQVSLNFLCAPIAEQLEIVRRVENLFAFADRIEARLSDAKTTIDRVTPATLAKAFRGELVPQDPNDEPAITLIERILSERNQSGPGRRPRIQRAAPATRAPKEKSAMTKSRHDEEVKGQRYLANILRHATTPLDAESLFRLSDLPLVDFYKQLGWEVQQGYIRDNREKLEAVA